MAASDPDRDAPSLERDSPALRPTFFIDHDHPSVRAFAAEAAGAAQDPALRAIRLFLAVREGVRYDPYTISYRRESYRASETLARGRAYCIPKAVLLAAAARAQGIPARLGFADVTNHLATGKLLATLRTSLFAFHGFTELWLDGRWVKVTPAFNASLCQRFGARPIDFDGRTDAVLQPTDLEGRRFMEYLADRGHHDDLPYDEMVRVFKELYPHLTGPDGEAVLDVRDFEADAAAERGRGST